MTDALLRFEVTRRLLFSVAVAFLVHALIVLALPHGAHRAVLTIVPHAVDVDLAEPKAEPAIPPTREERPTERPKTPVAIPHRAPHVLARDDSQHDPKGESVPVGDDDASRGGKVSSSSNVDGPPVVGSVTVGGSGVPPREAPAPPSTIAPPPPRPVDRSRPAALLGKTEWSCPWPDEAEDIDLAYVTITITVDPSGHATKVDVVDPGHGFGREARRCAMQRTYVPALDRDGRPITATTKPIRVRFAR